MAPRIFNNRVTKTRETKPTQDKNEDATNMIWLRILEFGAVVFNEKVNEQSLTANVPEFIVLP